jgi:hypothetical protein
VLNAPVVGEGYEAGAQRHGDKSVASPPFVRYRWLPRSPTLMNRDIAIHLQESRKMLWFSA